MKGPQTPEWQRWAQFRLSVIGELLFCPPPWGQLKTALDRLSGRTYQHPIDPKRQVRFGASTIERWYYQAKDAPDPIAVLGRRIRSDAGTRKTVSEPFLAALKEQYESHRSWSVQLHYDNLIALSEEQPQLQPMPSYKTVLRSMRDNGWYRRREPVRPTAGQQLAAQRLERREVRSYEVPHIHGLWHLDFHQASISFLNAAGQWQHPIALAILDDYSRICCHLQFYLAETAECLIHGLMQALMKRGLPRALLTDNGAAMLAEETRNGLERLGIDHKTTLPYSPYQNGKQEVFWGQLEGRLLSMLKGVDGMNLSLLNTAAQAWVEQEYHRKVHREIQTTPIARLMNGKSVARQTPDSDFMHLAFTRRMTRKPRRSDATVTVNGIRYELPARFSHLASVVLRSPGWDKSQMTLVDPKTDAPLVRLLPQDKRKNASGIRRCVNPSGPVPAPSISTPLPAPETSMPALIKKLMADYAATGLPPAYMPKEELDDEPK